MRNVSRIQTLFSITMLSLLIPVNDAHAAIDKITSSTPISLLSPSRGLSVDAKVENSESGA